MTTKSSHTLMTMFHAAVDDGAFTLTRHKGIMHGPALYLIAGGEGADHLQSDPLTLAAAPLAALVVAASLQRTKQHPSIPEMLLLWMLRMLLISSVEQKTYSAAWTFCNVP